VKKFLVGVCAIVLMLGSILYISLEKMNLEAQEVMADTGKISLYSGECDHGEDIFCSQFPIILVNTNDQEIKKNSKIWVNISVIDRFMGNNHIEDEAQLEALSTIKYRGNSSWFGFDKKQYRIEFYETQNQKLGYALTGMGAHSDWVLNAPFLDRTLLRNHLMYGISREIMEWAPDTHYCEVFVNGEYMGVYLIIEPVTSGGSRLNLYPYSMASGQTSYVINRERDSSEDNEILTYGKEKGFTSLSLSISHPGKTGLLTRQMNWITQDVGEFERVLYSDDFADPTDGYSKHIDVQSFVDYYIINEFAINVDAGSLSTYIYRNLGGKMKMAVWDFNNAFNNYQWEDHSYDEFYLTQTNWFDRLLCDTAFVDRVVERYLELRQGVLSEEHLLTLIDKNVAYLGEAIDRNFEVWGYTFSEKLLSSDENGQSRDPGSYEEAIAMLKETIIARGNFMDENIESLYELCIN